MILFALYSGSEIPEHHGNSVTFASFAAGPPTFGNTTTYHNMGQCLVSFAHGPPGPASQTCTPCFCAGTPRARSENTKQCAFKPHEPLPVGRAPPNHRCPLIVEVLTMENVTVEQHEGSILLKSDGKRSVVAALRVDLLKQL